MNLKLFMSGENQKWQRRKTLSNNEKNRFYSLQEFVKFCLKNGVTNTDKIDSTVYSHYVQHLKHVKKNSARTRLYKGYIVKSLLSHGSAQFIPNPWRAYVNSGEYKERI